jgi:hypothetical protein
MIYTVKAIIPPNVFIEDTDGNADRVHMDDFVERPRLNTSVNKNCFGRFVKVNSIVDPDCVGGSCPIR